MSAGEFVWVVLLACGAVFCFDAWYRRRPRVRSTLDCTLPPREESRPKYPDLPKPGTWVLVFGRRACVIDDGLWDGEGWRDGVLVMFDNGSREYFTPAQWAALKGAEPPAVVG